MATTIEMLRDRDEPGYPLNFTSVFFLGAPRMPKLPVKELTLEEITNAVERFLGMFPDLCVQVQHMYFRDRMSVPEIRDALMINVLKVRANLEMPFRYYNDLDACLFLKYGQAGLDYVHSLPEEELKKLRFTGFKNNEKPSGWLTVIRGPEKAKPAKRQSAGAKPEGDDALTDDELLAIYHQLNDEKKRLLSKTILAAYPQEYDLTVAEDAFRDYTANPKTYSHQEAWEQILS